MRKSWGTVLCPWLVEPFERLDRARRDGRLGHAWLFAGARGLGKDNLACALAHRVLDPGSPSPGRLDPATAIELLRARHDELDHDPDLHFLLPAADKRTITVEQVREAIGALELTSLRGVAKALIVGPAEAMTLAAANALLKTLEEPTTSTYFFLVSHQPGFLPATVRSRCQIFALKVPPPEQALDWLSGCVDAESRPDLEALLSLSGGAPLRALALNDSGFSNVNKELEEIFKTINEDRADPQAVADSWLKRDPEVLLGWLSVRLEWAIKARLAPDASTPVTDRGDGGLHNAWRSLTVAALFERLEATRSLLAQLGGGVNLELALRVLLLGFQPGSERT